MDYLASLDKAIEYIEHHLDEELIAEDVAKAAGYSVYHLTHIFTAVIGVLAVVRKTGRKKEGQETKDED